MTATIYIRFRGRSSDRGEIILSALNLTNLIVIFYIFNEIDC